MCAFGLRLDTALATIICFAKYPTIPDHHLIILALFTPLRNKVDSVRRKPRVTLSPSLRLSTRRKLLYTACIG